MTNHPNRSNERVTLTNLSNEQERVTLPTPHYDVRVSGQADGGTGVWITGLYSGPRTGRKFVRSHSIWDRGDGSTVGTTYREIDESQYLAYCDRVGCDPLYVSVTEA